MQNSALIYAIIRWNPFSIKEYTVIFLQGPLFGFLSNLVLSFIKCQFMMLLHWFPQFVRKKNVRSHNFLKLLNKHLFGLLHINRNFGRRIGMSTLFGKHIFWSFSSNYVFFSDIYGFLNYDLRNWSVFIAKIVCYVIFTCLNLIFCK